MNECLAELSDTQTVERLNWRAGEGEKSTGLGMRIAEGTIPSSPAMKTQQTAHTTAVSAAPTSPDRSAEAGIPGRDFEHGR
jgi:uncharacterized protein YwlG (UPF0340 family)